MFINEVYEGPILEMIPEVSQTAATPSLLLEIAVAHPATAFLLSGPLRVW